MLVALSAGHDTVQVIDPALSPFGLSMSKAMNPFIFRHAQYERIHFIRAGSLVQRVAEQRSIQQSSCAVGLRMPCDNSKHGHQHFF